MFQHEHRITRCRFLTDNTPWSTVWTLRCVTSPGTRCLHTPALAYLPCLPSPPQPREAAAHFICSCRQFHRLPTFAAHGRPCRITLRVGHLPVHAVVSPTLPNHRLACIQPTRHSRQPTTYLSPTTAAYAITALPHLSPLLPPSVSPPSRRFSYAVLYGVPWRNAANDGDMTSQRHRILSTPAYRRGRVTYAVLYDVVTNVRRVAGGAGRWRTRVYTWF